MALRFRVLARLSLTYWLVWHGLVVAEVSAQSVAPAADEDPREALQVGEEVAADGVQYMVAAFEMERDPNGGLRPASYLVERT